MRRWSSSACLLMLLGLIAGSVLRPGTAYAWWNDDWALRRRITIDTGANGAAINDAIGTAAVLIRLHVGNMRFEEANQDGSDLRFVADDDKTPLKFHIERFDGLLGEAFVWVRVPDLRPGAQTSIWLYYGNKKATPAQDARGTYDADTVLVYHFGERGLPHVDSSSWGNTALSAGLLADGALIGPGLRLDGQTTVTLPASPSLLWSEGQSMTWSAWVKPAGPQPNGILYSRRDGANLFRIGLDNGVPFVELTNAAGTRRSNAGGPISMGEWHQIAVVAAQQISLYADGAVIGTLDATLPAFNSSAVLGGDAPAPAAQPAASPDAAPAPDAAAAAPDAAPAAPAAPAATNFVGELDELQIAKTARPAGFIRAAAVGQGGSELSTRFLSLGPDEETTSWISGYFAVILRSVTLDGWVVIGLLAIISVISWVVMIDKAAYVGRARRANAAFREHFHDMAADLTALDEDDVDDLEGVPARRGRQIMRHSSLFRVYRIGAEEIRRRFPGRDAQRGKALSAASIAAIRAALDSGLVLETQRLNRMMVILTIAISGGPFLGLLGTVVGVMITFAAIAQSGDVNVNAIAPGIAAALVATVAGLAVAIPALFGYNYLISRIKDATSDLQVFVDEFVTKMAEAYSPGTTDRLAAE